MSQIDDISSLLDVYTFDEKLNITQAEKKVMIDDLYKDFQKEYGELPDTDKLKIKVLDLLKRFVLSINS